MTPVGPQIMFSSLWIPPRQTPCTNRPEIWVDTINSGGNQEDLTDDGHKKDHPDTKLAKEACLAECPFLLVCLEEAMRLEGTKDDKFRQGVWGGATPRERVNIMEHRRATGERFNKKFTRRYGAALEREKHVTTQALEQQGLDPRDVVSTVWQAPSARKGRSAAEAPAEEPAGQ